MATSSAAWPPSKAYDLDATVVSAKHLKNVNWRNGDLKPYVILWVDPDRRIATKPDDSGSTKPVWNERFVLPLPFPPRDATLTLEIFHSNPSEALKPLVGTLMLELRDLVSEPEESAIRLRNFEIRRPSGRPHGRISLKLGVVDRPLESYHPGPHSAHYYSSAPPPHRGYAHSPYPLPAFSPPPSQPFYYSDPHSGYYSAYYSHHLPPRPSYERQGGYGGPGPSAPVDYTPYDYHKPSVGGSGAGMGASVGALAGGLGGLALGESVKHEEERVVERGENEWVSDSRSGRYGGHRSDY